MVQIVEISFPENWRDFRYRRFVIESPDQDGKGRFGQKTRKNLERNAENFNQAELNFRNMQFCCRINMSFIVNLLWLSVETVGLHGY